MSRKMEWAQRVQVEIVACTLLCMLSIPGALLSVFLTIVKFRSDYRCDHAMLSACSIGDWFDCNRVLDSQASTLLQLPISAYSTGYYLVVLVLAGAALWRPRLLSVLRPVLQLLGCLGLLAVVGLAAYATFLARGLCSYCVVIYGLTTAIFLATALLYPQGLRSGLRSLFVPWRQRQGGVLLLTGLAFLASVSMQMVQYRRNASQLHFDAKCVLSDGDLPETSLRAGSDRPKAQIALFIDLACQHCRREFEFWSAFVATHPEDHVLAIYHYAREGDCLPPDARGFSNVATQNYSCLAAEAAECAELLRPDTGAGLAMIAALFAFQDRGTPYFTELTILDAARSIGFTDVPEDSHEHPFNRCVRNHETIPQIAEHARFALDQGLVTTPVTYLTFYQPNGERLPQVIRIKGAKQYGSAERTLALARTVAMGDATGPVDLTLE